MKKYEALLVPFPAQGHMNPMMQLAQSFLQQQPQDFCVSFVITEFNLKRLQQSSSATYLQTHQNFRFLVVSDGLPLRDPRIDVGKLFEATRTMIVPFVESRIIAQLHNNNNNAQETRVFVVADAIASPVLKSAQSNGLPNASLWTSATAVLAQICNLPDLVASSSIPPNGVFKEELMVELKVPLMPSFSSRDLPWAFSFTEPVQESIFQQVLGFLPFTEKSDWVLCNSVYQLESPVFDYVLAKNISVCPIGPLQIACNAGFTTALWKEDLDCLQWLDKQLPKSVIYVSFGSLATISAAQFEELALGLDITGLPFLWVVRDDFVKDSDYTQDGGPLSAKLSERLKKDMKGGTWGDKGCVVSWCSQMKVLGHPSVACFITHCGWNSTIEALYHGVPMLCWPSFGDQAVNSKYIVDVWKVGLMLKRRGEKKGLVERQDIKIAIHDVVGGQEGINISRNMGEVQKFVKASVDKGGSSAANFGSFVEGIRSRLG